MRKHLLKLINKENLSEEDLRIAHTVRQELHRSLIEESWEKVYIGRKKLQ